MKIAYIINSLEGGGAQMPIPAIFKVLSEHGIEVKLYALSRRNGLSIPKLEKAGLDWVCFEGKKKQHFKASKWLLKHLRNDRPDIIWTSLTQATFIGQILGKICNIPVISWQHNAYLKRTNNFLLMLSKGLTSFWVTDSEIVKQLTIQRFKVSEKNVLILPLFQADTNKPKCQIWQPGNTLKIASLGRLHLNKGYDVLIDAISELKLSGQLPKQDFEINIAGVGADEKTLKLQSERAGVSEVNFVGFKSDVDNFLADHHVYIQPSRYEGLGIAAHEAMVVGMPILCSRIGQMYKTTQDGISAWHCNPDDSSDLARTLKKMLEEPDRIQEMGQIARSETIDLFSVSKFKIAINDVITRAQTLL